MQPTGTAMQPTVTTISLADAINQIEERMPGNPATSRATKTSVNNRWSVREEEL